MARHHMCFLFAVFAGYQRKCELLSLLKPRLAWSVSWLFLIGFDMSLLYATLIQSDLVWANGLAASFSNQWDGAIALARQIQAISGNIWRAKTS